MSELLIFLGGGLFGAAVERACASYRSMKAEWQPPRVQDHVALERAARERFEAEFRRFDSEARKRETEAAARAYSEASKRP